MSSFLLWLIVTLLFLTGLAGIVIPFLPGILLIFLGVLIYAAATDFTTISQLTVLVTGLLAIAAWLADYYGSGVGARLAGGGKVASFGSIAGAIIGVIIAGPPGLLLGAFLGALAGAIYEGARPAPALRTAIFAILGTVGATIVQLLLGVSSIIAFFLALVI